MLLDVGVNRWLELLKNDLYKGELGTSDSSLSVTNTDLDSPVSATLKTPSSSASNRTLVVDYILDSVTAVGSTFKEYGTFINSTASTIFNRVVYPSYTHSSTKEFQISSIIRVKK